MASQSFRDSMHSLGWSRREPDPPASNDQTPLWSRLNPFGGGGGYVRLPTHENPGAPLPAPTRREEDEGWFVLSRWDRMLIFGGLNLAAIAMFVVCFALLPTGVFVLKPRKFAILWTMASVLFLASWAVMMGLIQYAYFGSIALTLYFALGLVCLLWYLVSYFPMGSSGLRFAARLGGNRVAAWMND